VSRAGALLAAVALAACAGARGGTAPAIERADGAFREGRYTESAAAYEEHLRARPDDERNERVRLRLALIHFVYGAPAPDAAEGERWLNELVRLHPDGELRDVAQYILALRGRLRSLEGVAGSGQSRERELRGRIARLEAQLEALRRIDLEGREP
jgi:hypothetical protein